MPVNRPPTALTFREDTRRSTRRIFWAMFGTQNLGSQTPPPPPTQQPPLGQRRAPPTPPPTTPPSLPRPLPLKPFCNPPPPPAHPPTAGGPVVPDVQDVGRQARELLRLRRAVQGPGLRAPHHRRGPHVVEEPVLREDPQQEGLLGPQVSAAKGGGAEMPPPPKKGDIAFLRIGHGTTFTVADGALATP